MDGTIELARSRAYEAVTHLRWPGMQHRTDIAAPSDHSVRYLSATGPERRPTQEVSG